MNRWAAALLLLALSSPATATYGRAPGTEGPPPTLESYLDDLTGNDKPDRLLAARELRRAVRTAVRISGRRKQDSVAVSEALVVLDEFDRRLAPRCIRVLKDTNITGVCADILRMLETTEALPALREARAGEARRRHARKLDKAIELIEALDP